MKIYGWLLPFLFMVLSCSDQEDPTYISVLPFNQQLTENPEQNQLIGKVRVESNMGDLTFRILSENPQGSLMIDSSSGELYVKDSAFFDYELYPMINALIEVSFGNTSSKTHARIEVLDVLDAKLEDYFLKRVEKNSYDHSGEFVKRLEIIYEESRFKAANTYDRNLNLINEKKLTHWDRPYDLSMEYFENGDLIRRQGFGTRPSGILTYSIMEGSSNPEGNIHAFNYSSPRIDHRIDIEVNDKNWNPMHVQSWLKMEEGLVTEESKDEKVVATASYYGKSIVQLKTLDQEISYEYYDSRVNPEYMLHVNSVFGRELPFNLVIVHDGLKNAADLYAEKLISKKTILDPNGQLIETTEYEFNEVELPISSTTRIEENGVVISTVQTSYDYEIIQEQ